MKQYQTKIYRTFSSCIIAIFLLGGETFQTKAQNNEFITIISQPIQVAIAGQEYQYIPAARLKNDLNSPTIKYRLIEHPAGMNINHGIVTWQPEEIQESKQIVLEAYSDNGAAPDTQRYMLNITGEKYCAESIYNLYGMEHTLTDVNNDIKNNNHFASITGKPEVADGILNHALAFDGDDGIALENPDAFNWNSEISFTLSVWVKDTHASSINEVVIGRDSRDVSDKFVHFWLGINTFGYATFYLHDNDRNPWNNEEWKGGLADSTGIYLLDGKWHHLAAVRSNEDNRNRLYVDGMLVAISMPYDYPSDFADEPGEGPVTIGYMDITDQYFYTGTIDEVAIIETALTNQDIQSYYNSVKESKKGFCTTDNENPYFESTPNKNATLNEVYTYDIEYGDPDEEDVLILKAQLPSWLTLENTKNDNEATLTGVPSTVSHSLVKLTVNDGIDETIQAFNIFFQDPDNSPPEITSVAPEVATEDQLYSYSIQFTDPDENDSIILMIDLLPEWLMYDTANYELKGTPTYEDAGEYNFEIVAVDIAGNSDTESIALNVQTVNDVPVIVSVTDTTIISINSTLTLQLSMLNVTDEDNNYPAEFSLSVLEGENYTFSGNQITPTADYTGTLLVNVQVNDGTDNSETFKLPVVVKESVGIRSHFSSTIHVYPNPVKNNLTIEWNDVDIPEVRILIFNSAGKLVKDVELKNKTNVIYIDEKLKGSFVYQIVVNEKEIIDSGTLIIE